MKIDCGILNANIKLNPQNITLEIRYDKKSDKFIFNILFLDTGEIRQKRRSSQWVLNRIFNSELKTYKKNWNEILFCTDVYLFKRPVNNGGKE